MSARPRNATTEVRRRTFPIMVATSCGRTLVCVKVARPLFPFNFRECRGCVAGVVVVEQFPMWPFGGGGLPCGGSDRFALAVERPDIGEQCREVAAFVGQCRWPIAHRAVTGDDASRGQGLEFLEDGKPA